MVNYSPDLGREVATHRDGMGSTLTVSAERFRDLYILQTCKRCLTWTHYTLHIDTHKLQVTTTPGERWIPQRSFDKDRETIVPPVAAYVSNKSVDAHVGIGPCVANVRTNQQPWLSA